MTTDNERTPKRRRDDRIYDIAQSLRDRIVALEAERDERGNLLALAAAEINCSGPVHERIRVLRRELTDRAESAESRLAIATATMEAFIVRHANGGKLDACMCFTCKFIREALAQIHAGKE